MRIIIFDFEVFKYDTLLGCKILDNNYEKIFQTWDLDEIRQFYNDNKNEMWIGHNNLAYDNNILNAIIKGKDPYEESISLLNSTIRKRSKIPTYSYDLMNNDMYSLKVTEAATGKNISESKVDFNIDRPLTSEEKWLTETYNQDDLEQTHSNFKSSTLFGTFCTRIDVIKEFNLDPKELCSTEAKLASLVFHCKKIDGIENQIIKPQIYDKLRLNNTELLDFYMNEEFRKNSKKVINVAGVDITIGAGGAHSAIKKYHCDKCLYCDVSGYYNLIMMKYDLLPRTIPQEYYNLYETLYHKQLEYKKTNPKKRAALKVVLLAVFGAMTNEYTDLYDPQKGSLVPITGELFICDLIEKLEGHAKIIQTNTDGIIIEPYDWDKYDEIISIIEEWENRTGFVIKKELKHNFWQRDVNNYLMLDDNDKITCKGEAVGTYGTYDDIFKRRSFDSKEPLIVAKGVVDYLLFNILPEETVKNNENNLILFQYICKLKSFDYMIYEENNIINNEINRYTVQNINRAFALNDKNIVGMIYKMKNDGKKTKVSNLPNSVFIHNESILDDKIINELKEKIDYEYYINRIYERINEFIDTPQIKGIEINE